MIRGLTHVLIYLSDNQETIRSTCKNSQKPSDTGQEMSPSILYS
ncbi:predicted protein [Botrytis cinerea T4]|uniref:Uncharacterized protein n=1 Tax=Botryotinia fuckeliana (strain T4) TaxID=999810 RepID=G2XU73_BOTF4|nr:predicted protein [Botrytis cinerea T4]